MVKRCSRCIMPETIPNITFDKNGVCNYCNEYTQPNSVTTSYSNLNNIKERKDKFNNLIRQAKEKRIQSGSKYDVMVALSGGRDSSYVAWALSKMELNVLCVNYNNPFSSPQTMINIKNLIKKINADLITFQFPNKRQERCSENNLKAWLKRPDLGSIGLVCLPCKAIYLEFFKIAKKHNISLIWDGSSPNEGSIFKLEARAGKGVRAHSLQSYLTMGSNFIKNYRYLKPCNIIPGISTLLSLDGNTSYLRWRYPDIEKCGYFWFHPYNEEEVDQVLKDVGWSKAKDNKSPWRFDCEIDSLKNYLYIQLIGATEKDDRFSKDIRSGLMTREEALQRLEEGEVNIDIVKRVLKKIHMTLSDLDLIEKK